MSKTYQARVICRYGDKGRASLAALPKRITDMASRFGLRDLKPVTNLTYHYVLSGFQGDIPIVLKLDLESESLSKEAFALRCFAHFGAVNVIAEEDGCLLLQRALPGISLKSYFPDKDQEAIAITCTVIKRLHQACIPKHHRFAHIKEWLSALDKEWDIPAHFLQKAKDLREQLLATSGPDMLLHGDLHHDNILQNGDDWVVIDPKGVIGEQAYEIAAFIRNPIPALLMEAHATQSIQNRINQFSRALGIPITRIADWCFVQAVLAWTWALQDNDDTIYWKQITSLFDRL